MRQRVLFATVVVFIGLAPSGTYANEPISQENPELAGMQNNDDDGEQAPEPPPDPDCQQTECITIVGNPPPPPPTPPISGPGGSGPGGPIGPPLPPSIPSIPDPEPDPDDGKQCRLDTTAAKSRCVATASRIFANQTTKQCDPLAPNFKIGSGEIGSDLYERCIERLTRDHQADKDDCQANFDEQIAKCP